MNSYALLRGYLLLNCPHFKYCSQERNESNMTPHYENAKFLPQLLAFVKVTSTACFHLKHVATEDKTTKMEEMYM